MTKEKTSLKVDVVWYDRARAEKESDTFVAGSEVVKDDRKLLNMVRSRVGHNSFVVQDVKFH